MLGSELGDPVQVRDQPLGQPILWPGEQIQQRAASGLIVAVEWGQFHLRGVGRLSVEQSAKEAQIDCLEKLGINEFLQVLRHIRCSRWLVECSSSVLTVARPTSRIDPTT